GRRCGNHVGAGGEGQRDDFLAHGRVLVVVHRDHPGGLVEQGGGARGPARGGGARHRVAADVAGVGSSAVDRGGYLGFDAHHVGELGGGVDGGDVPQDFV